MFFENILRNLMRLWRERKNLSKRFPRKIGVRSVWIDVTVDPNLKFINAEKRCKEKKEGETMKFVKNLFVAAVVCCLSLTAMAGGSVAKDEAICIGPFQAYNFSWWYYPDVYGFYSAQVKKNSDSISNFQNRFSSTNSSYCKFVGFGTPFGSTTHNWRAAGFSPGTDYTAWENFYQGQPCKGGIND